MTTTSTIAEQVATHHRASAGQLPPEVAEAFATEQRDLAAAGNSPGVAEPGSRLPDGELLDVADRPTTLAQNLGGKPAVIVFYRGAWCPYCNIALRTAIRLAKRRQPISLGRHRIRLSSGRRARARRAQRPKGWFFPTEVGQMAANAIALAKQGVDVFNRADWTKTREISTEDVVYVEAASGRSAKGIDEFLAIAKGWKGAFPDAKGTVTSELESGDVAVIEVTWNGTQTGPLLTPTGDTIPATGKKVNIPAVQIVRVANGKIAETKHYFDLMTMMVQLGVVPAAARN